MVCPNQPYYLLFSWRFCFKFHGALSDAWSNLKKMDLWNLTPLRHFEMDSNHQDRILYVSRGCLHEENDCMFLRIKRTLKVLRNLLLSYSLILCNHTQQQKIASWVHSGLCSNTRDLAVLVVDLFVDECCPCSFSSCSAALVLKAWPYPVFCIRGLHIVQVHLPLS